LVVLIVFLLLMNFAKPATCMYISRTYVHNKYFTQPICQIWKWHVQLTSMISVQLCIMSTHSAKKRRGALDSLGKATE